MRRVCKARWCLTRLGLSEDNGWWVGAAPGSENVREQALVFGCGNVAKPFGGAFGPGRSHAMHLAPQFCHAEDEHATGLEPALRLVLLLHSIIENLVGESTMESTR